MSRDKPYLIKLDLRRLATDLDYLIEFVGGQEVWDSLDSRFLKALQETPPDEEGKNTKEEV
jgi:hypothetical protein